MPQHSLSVTVWPPGVPQSVRSFLARLPDKVDQLLELATRHGGARLARALCAVSQHMGDLVEYLEGLGQDELNSFATATNRLRDGAVGLALLRLVAFSMRVAPPGTSADATAGSSALASTSRESTSLPSANTAWMRLGHPVFSVIKAMAAVHPPTPATITFLRRLLAMQTLQACARQLAAAADLLLLPQDQLSEAAKGFVVYTLDGMQTLITCMGVCSAASDRSYITQVAAALRESHVLEHAARLMLRVESKQALIHCARAFAVFYTSTDEFIMSASGNPLTEELALAAAASGPCADFLAMALGLATLCAADGGPSYGLPQEVTDRLPVITVDNLLDSSSALLASGPVDRYVPIALSVAVIRSAQSGRLRLRTAVALLLRLSRLGLASAQAVEMPGPSASSGGATRGEEQLASGTSNPSAGQRAPGTSDEAPGRPLGVLLRPSDGAELALGSLARVWELLKDRPAAWADVAEEWWRMAVGLCGAPCVRLAPGEELEWRLQLGPLLTVPLPQAGALAPAPPPAVSSALAAGLVPALERLVRRAGEDPEGGETAVLAGLAVFLSQQLGTSKRFLFHLMAHSDPRQAAALVASLGKVQRSAAPPRVRSEADLLLQAFLYEGHSDLQMALGAADQPDPVAAVPAQLPALLGCVLYDFMPFLWQSKTQRMAPVALVRWLPVVAAAAHLAAQPDAGQGHQVEAAAHVGPHDGPSNSSGEGASSNSLGGCGGGNVRSWERLLWQEVDAVGLLGLLMAQQEELDTATDLANACTTLAALYPDKVRGPTLAAVAAASATAGGPCGGLVAGNTPAGGTPLAEKAAGLPWPPSQLHGLAARMTDASHPEVSASLAVLASLVEAWADPSPGGSSSSPGEVEAALLAELRRLTAPAVRDLERLARLLGPPVDLASLLGGPTCANPDCTSLKGDSELGVRLQQCGRCGAVGYCCRECQTAHWRAGHKAECGARARGDGGAADAAVGT